MPTHIPEYVFAMFQGKFAIITPALIAGAFAERVNFKGYAVFIALWSLLVYSPICHWVWAADGFLFNLGAMGAIDFAGGTVVHISSGVTALVAALYLGKRRGYPNNVMQPNNLVMTLIGAGLLWVWWFCILILKRVCRCRKLFWRGLCWPAFPWECWRYDGGVLIWWSAGCGIWECWCR